MSEPLGACQPQFTSVCAEDGQPWRPPRCPGLPGSALKEEEDKEEEEEEEEEVESALFSSRG